MMFLILIETTSKMLLLLALQIQLIVKNIDNRGLNNDPLLTNISKNHDFKLNQKPPYKKNIDIHVNLQKWIKKIAFIDK